MKKLIVYISFLVSAICAPSSMAALQSFSLQEQNESTATDSIATVTELEELVVSGAYAYRIQDGIAYEPDNKVRRHSYSAFSLLQQMAIPSLNADPTTGKVTTIQGEAIAYYIDYMPASANECRNLYPHDVLRVEVLEHPSDPRFQGAPNVVNFIMRKYAGGGYAKAQAEQGFWRDAGLYTLYDKTVYKKMTYDVAGGYTYSNLHEGLRCSTAEYQFPDNPVSVTTESDLPTIRSRRYFASFKALYSNEKGIQIANTAGISGDHSPSNTIRRSYTFSPGVYPDGYTSTTTRDRPLNLYWNGNYSIPLSGEWHLQLAPAAGWSRTHRDQSFVSSTEDYTYSIKENMWDANLTAWLSKAIPQGQLALMTGGSYMHDRMEYLSSTDQDVMQQKGNFDFSFYGIHYIKKVYLNYNLMGTVSWQNNSGFRHTRFLPGASIFTQYRPSRPHTFALNMAWYTEPISASELNEARVQMSMIDVITGNPHLKPTTNLVGHLSYSWMGTPPFALSAFAGVQYRPRPVTPEYSPKPGTTPVMVRRFVNTGYLFTAEAGIGANLRLLSNTLIFNGNISLKHYRNRAFSLIRAISVPVSISGQYFLNAFRFGASVSTPQTYVNPGAKGRSMLYYDISAGYTVQNLNINLTVANFAGSTWKGYWNENINPVYHSRDDYWHYIPHRQITLTLTYTLRYGKRVEQGQEIKADRRANSGILSK